MTKRFGFTLAEVLITLGIIGVVAAMTIPTLMNQTGQAEFRTGFKKMMSTLNQAVTMSVALDDLSFADVVAGTDTQSIAGLLDARMNIISQSEGATMDDVSTEVVVPSGTGTTTIENSAKPNYTMYFNDGMAIMFNTDLEACTESNKCTAYVDVNGTKKPNKLTTGSDCESLEVKDRFAILFYDQQVLPGDVAARCIMYK